MRVRREAEGGGGGLGHYKANPVGFSTWHTSLLMKMTSDLALKQFKLNIPILISIEFSE